MDLFRKASTESWMGREKQVLVGAFQALRVWSLQHSDSLQGLVVEWTIGDGSGRGVVVVSLFAGVGLVGALASLRSGGFGPG